MAVPFQTLSVVAGLFCNTNFGVYVCWCVIHLSYRLTENTAWHLHYVTETSVCTSVKLGWKLWLGELRDL